MELSFINVCYSYGENRIYDKTITGKEIRDCETVEDLYNLIFENKMETFNPFTLSGKTIFVTGASSGIGKAIAIACSKNGSKM